MLLRRPGIRRLVFAAAACLLAAVVPAGAQSSADLAPLLVRVEEVLKSGNPGGYLSLLSQSADRRRAAEFASQVVLPRATRAVVRERDRGDLPGTLPGDGYQLLVEVLTEFGSRARLATWRLDVRRRGDASPGSPEAWGIVDQQTLTSLAGLYRLALTPTTQYTATNLVVSAEDVRLRLESGSVFVAETDAGPTALVLIGRGDLSFTPAPKVERGQVRIVTGSDTLTSPFDVALVRVPPAEADEHVDRKALTPRPVDPREFRRAEEIFRDEAAKSFGLDLGDLSSEAWSLLPNTGDFLAEVHTRRFDTLTYARSTGDVEDISLFDRRNHRNIAHYSSKTHFERFGQFYDEDDQADFTVTHYDVNVAFAPARRFLAGRARLNVEILSPVGASSLGIRLADSLAVRSVVSPELGRLMSVRVRNQNMFVVNLPSTLTRGVHLTLDVEYEGPLVPQPIDREALGPQQLQVVDENADAPMEDSFLYSNRSFWYPQPPATGYATASIRVSVPAPYGCVASGDPLPVPPAPGQRPGVARTFAFVATQPLRYLSFLASRFVDVGQETLRLGEQLRAAAPERREGVFYDDVEVLTQSNPRLRGRAREMTRTTQDVLRFYSSIVGDCPYPTLTLALVERLLPAGHSPGYLAVISQPTAGAKLSFREDPASFPEFPEFFVAHELAHQWWGQAVGWKNYHEQWLSEGFAQYFAALYAERVRGREVFDSMLRKMLRWARDDSDQGPLYLGYRVGHVKGDSRVFRAIVYNKGAFVLHMLRQWLGDRAFFAGLRRYYSDWRFSKAGSDDLRAAMEAASGVPLGRFFDQWVYGQDLPSLTFSWRKEPDGQTAVVHLEQSGGEFDLPVTLTLEYADKPPAEVLVKLGGRAVDARVPLPPGTLRRIDVNRQETLAIVR